MRAAAIALLALLATSCLGPPYQTPPLADVGRGFSPPTPGGGGLKPRPTLTTFGDPILDELIDDAISGNLDLRAAAARVREARAQRGIAAARGNPQVDAVAVAADTNRDALFDAGFDAAWEIDFFGGVRRDVEAAIAQVEAIEANERDVEITLVAEVARNYVELRGAQTRLDVLDARITTLRETLEIVSARRDGGLANDLDVARSEGLLEDTASARPALEYSVVAAIRRLAVLTGRQPAALRDRLAAHAPIPVVHVELAIATPVERIAQRPDVRRAERELAAETARIGVARADLYPRIALFGTLGRRSDDGRDFGGASSRYWAFGPSLRWPLLSGGRVRSRIDAQIARRDQATAAYEHSVLRAIEDVENALAGYGRAQRERERLAQAVASERRAVDLASARYRAGLDNFLTVLDAQRTLRDGEDRLAAADTRIALSAIALYKSLGGRASSPPAAGILPNAITARTPPG